jgi:K+-transporting ATPase KdpF subunit
MCAGAKSCGNDGGAMTWESILLLVASALLCVYLIYALLRPEKF